MTIDTTKWNSTLTLGGSGDTAVTILASGATQFLGFGTASGTGSTGEVSWNTTKITADHGHCCKLVMDIL